jgi:hypothetical protein
MEQTDMDFHVSGRKLRLCKGNGPSRAARLSAEQLRMIYDDSLSRPTGRGEPTVTVDACYVHVTGIEGDERSRAVIGLVHAAFPFFYYLIISVWNQLLVQASNFFSS